MATQGGIYRAGAIRLTGQSVELGLLQAHDDEAAMRIAEGRFKAMYAEPYASLFASNDPWKRDIPFEDFVRSWDN